MKMTEEEAKTKWCPHARVATYPVDGSLAAMTATNKTSTKEIRDGAYCIGSACMMWRKLPTWKPDPDDPDLADFVAEGYCGLAGKS